ncbi:hypothetical protein DRO97_06810 [Archaeoglobales archaeon]|nr:MAG: hypothetical protein DRO97_06810 [Archaeoglobales archaeon]
MEVVNIEIDDALYEKIRELSEGKVEEFTKKALNHYIKNFKPIKFDNDSRLRIMVRSTCMINPGSIINVKLTEDELKKIKELCGEVGMRVHHFIKEAIKDYIYYLRKEKLSD